MAQKKQKYSFEIFSDALLQDEYRTDIEDYSIALSRFLFSDKEYKHLKVGKVAKYYETQPELIFRDCGTKVSAGYSFVGVRIAGEKSNSNMDVFSYMKNVTITIEHLIAVNSDVYKTDNLPLITDRISRVIRGGYSVNPININGETIRFRFLSDDRLFYSGSKFIEGNPPIEIRSLKMDANIYII